MPQHLEWGMLMPTGISNYPRVGGCQGWNSVMFKLHDYVVGASGMNGVRAGWCVHCLLCAFRAVLQRSGCGGFLLSGVCRGEMVMGFSIHLSSVHLLTVFQMMGRVTRCYMISTPVMVVVGDFQKDSGSELS